MILVDSSVWIHWFANYTNQHTAKLAKLDPMAIIVADLVVTEVLQGARTEASARQIEDLLSAFGILTICSPSIAIKSAENYRILRKRGITIRKTIDLIIGTFCIETGYSLLHADRDFDVMAAHLGLRLA